MLCKLYEFNCFQSFQGVSIVGITISLSYLNCHSMCDNLTVVRRQVRINLGCNLQLAAAETNTTIRLMSTQWQNLFLGPSLHLLIVEIASTVQRDKQEDNVT